jgi:nicotinamide phosphoribosyltransferase
MEYNLLLDVDSYKVSHPHQLPPGTEYTYSYIESRGGVFDRTLFFGLQMWLKKYLRPITTNQIDEASKFWKLHGQPFDRTLWDYIVSKHNGHLPILIKAVPEGLVIPVHNVLVTIVNTDPKCYWLPGFLETSMLRAVWYPTTVATVSWHAKQQIKSALEISSDLDVNSSLQFKLHDFSARGVSSEETASLGGCAHLVNFMGTDTVSGVLAARRYYSAEMAGFSIPAMEHQTVTTWTQDGEVDAYNNMIDTFGKPGSIIACVSDSYDLWNAVNNIWGETLREKVIKSGSTIVIRPDSGDPLTVPIKTIELLGSKFGYNINNKGFKVLHKSIRVIQGDGITIESIPKIIKNLLDSGWSIDNLSFGMGGGLGQMVTRDTLRFAQKCSAAQINSQWIDVYKNPVTDSGKKSKKGRLILTREKGHWETIRLNSNYDWADVLTPVWQNGQLLQDWTFDQIRYRSNLPALD